MNNKEITKEDKEAFVKMLEVHMNLLISEIDYLIEMHDRYGDTIQKSYLWEARHNLKDGVNWFDWVRKKKA